MKEKTVTCRCHPTYGRAPTHLASRFIPYLQTPVYLPKVLVEWVKRIKRLPSCDPARRGRRLPAALCPSHNRRAPPEAFHLLGRRGLRLVAVVGTASGEATLALMAPGARDSPKRCSASSYVPDPLIFACPYSWSFLELWPKACAPWSTPGKILLAAITSWQLHCIYDKDWPRSAIQLSGLPKVNNQTSLVSHLINFNTWARLTSRPVRHFR